MNRKEYMDADKLTDGAYDGSKGHDVHHEYFSQFVNSWIIDTVLSAIGKDRLLASRDLHLNDIPLKLWDNLPKTQWRISAASIPALALMKSWGKRHDRI
jgi:hypothetical protein